MREFTKSMARYGWAMSVFGVQQMVNLLTPQNGDATQKAADSFDCVSDAAANKLDASLKSAYQAGDKLQSQMVDMMMGCFGMGAMDPNRWMKMGSDMMKQSVNAAQKAAQSAGGCSGQSANGGSNGGTSAGGTTTGGSSPYPTGQPSSGQPTTPSGPPPATGQAPGWGPMPK